MYNSRDMNLDLELTNADFLLINWYTNHQPVNALGNEDGNTREDALK